MKRLRRWLLLALLVCAVLAAAEVVLLRAPERALFLVGEIRRADTVRGPPFSRR